MKNCIYLFFFLIFSYTSYSQLFVKDGSYIYNNDNVVYVKEDVNLELNSNFYLRNQAQLVQGKTGVSTNSGEGKVSVFQEGTSNRYVYNYWCSPVGVANGAAGNTNFGILLMNRPTSVTASNVITTTAYDGSSSTSSLVVAKYWIWKYLSANGYNLGGPNGWIHVQDTQTLLPGQGFTMKGVSGTDTTLITTEPTQANNPGNNQRYDFRGRPNDGDITIEVGEDDFTLTGNPYPSALNVSAFLLDPVNSACNGIAYYWEQNKTDNSHYLVDYHGGYGTYAPISAPYTGIYIPATFDTYNGDGTINTTGSSSGLVIERKYAPIGQGFMVFGAADGTITLKNEYREYVKEGSSLSQFEKVASPQVTTTANQVPHMRFDISLNNQNTRQIGLVLIPEATDGVDRGIDAKSPAEDTLPNDVYFFLDNDKYVVEGIPFDINKRIKVGVKSAANVPFNFKLSHVINFDQNQNVYLYDGLTQTYHDIKNGNYDVILPGGTINDRFEITFTASALNTAVNLEESFAIYQNNDKQTLRVENPTLLDVRSISLFDVTGKVIFGKEKLGIENEYEFSTSGISDGVYIVKMVTSDSQSLSHKIIVKNNKK
ncbi:T9SS type A sorting domain-containing protein [Flavobacterium ponti]|uniref:T9SS type A sorting domain-containing protein n=1 Tax=Flavobacterium ponti TaxID=665133 RepID=A0ABV9P059_9FLAO